MEPRVLVQPSKFVVGIKRIEGLLGLCLVLLLSTRQVPWTQLESFVWMSTMAQAFTYKLSILLG